MKGAALEGITFRHPLYDRDSVGVLGDYVTLEQGTGAVHTAPGHGADDFLTGMKYGLEIYAPIGPGGHFLDSVQLFGGQRVFDANPKVEQALADKGPALAPRNVLASVSALLALSQPGDLPGHVSVVRADGWRRLGGVRGRPDPHAARRCSPRDRSPGEMDSLLGTRPHLQHGRRTALTGASRASARGASRFRRSTARAAAKRCSRPN